MRGFLGGEQGAAEAVGERAAAADLDAEADRQVDRHAADPHRVAEQGVKRVEVVSERHLRIFEPGEDAAVAMVMDPRRGAPTDSRETICSTNWRSLLGGKVATISA